MNTNFPNSIHQSCCCWLSEAPHTLHLHTEGIYQIIQRRLFRRESAGGASPMVAFTTIDKRLKIPSNLSTYSQEPSFGKFPWRATGEPSWYKTGVRSCLCYETGSQLFTGRKKVVNNHTTMMHHKRWPVNKTESTRKFDKANREIVRATPESINHRTPSAERSLVSKGAASLLLCRSLVQFSLSVCLRAHHLVSGRSRDGERDGEEGKERQPKLRSSHHCLVFPTWNKFCLPSSSISITSFARLAAGVIPSVFSHDYDQHYWLEYLLSRWKVRKAPNQ